MKTKHLIATLTLITIVNISAQDLQRFQILDLSVNLPSKPEKVEVPLPNGATTLILSTTTYSSSIPSGKIGISKAVYPGDANLDGATKGSIEEVRRRMSRMGLTTHSEFKNRRVGGLEGRETKTTMSLKGQAISQFGLIFVRGNTIWSVNIIGPASVVTETFKESIFQSVRPL